MLRRCAPISPVRAGRAATPKQALADRGGHSDDAMGAWTGRAAILVAARQREVMDGHGKAFGYFALFTEIGLALFVTTLGGALAGRWLDERLGTSPLFVIAGFLLGALLGAVVDWRLISRFLEKLKD